MSIELRTFSIIDRNTALSTLTPNDAFEYDYTIDIDFNLGTTNMLFDRRFYRQNVDDSNQYDVDLTININNMSNLLMGTDSFHTPNGATISDLGMGIRGILGKRFVEIVALKIFGSAKAQAAIVNDGDFLGLSMASLVSQTVNASVQTDKTRVFRQYVEFDRIEQEANGINGYNDVDGWYAFNFDDTPFIFPMRLIGGVDASATSVLANGPDVGGSKFQNGKYDIPLKVIMR